MVRDEVVAISAVHPLHADWAVPVVWRLHPSVCAVSERGVRDDQAGVPSIASGRDDPPTYVIRVTSVPKCPDVKSADIVDWFTLPVSVKVVTLTALFGLTSSCAAALRSAIPDSGRSIVVLPTVSQRSVRSATAEGIQLGSGATCAHGTAPGAVGAESALCSGDTTGAASTTDDDAPDEAVAHAVVPSATTVMAEKQIRARLNTGNHPRHGAANAVPAFFSSPRPPRTIAELSSSPDYAG